MFGMYFKQSAWVLCWLLLPVALWLCATMIVFPLYEDAGYGESTTGNILGETQSGNYTVVEYESQDGWPGAFVYLFPSWISAVLGNFLFLMIIPCAAGGADAAVKHVQFYIGFFVLLALALTIPIILWRVHLLLDYIWILLALHLMMFIGTYLIGSRFVSPAYRRAFWFTYFS